MNHGLELVGRYKEGMMEYWAVAETGRLSGLPRVMHLVSDRAGIPAQVSVATGLCCLPPCGRILCKAV